MGQQEVSEQSKTSTIALVGAPNSGKTSLFNALTGLNQRVGNFPGVTVERKIAYLKQADQSVLRIMDLPGTNSLYPKSDDEAVTCNVLKNPKHPDHPDRVVVVADATQLRRGLLLCGQVIDMGFPTVLALNMMDIVRKGKAQLDTQKLSELIGIPVVELSARKSEGIDDLQKAIGLAQPGKQGPLMNVPPGFHTVLTELGEELDIDNEYLAFQALVQPGSMPSLPPEQADRYLKKAQLDRQSANRLISNELLVRLDHADELIQEVLIEPPGFREQLTENLDRVLTHRVWGYVIFLLLLLIIFQSIFSWATVPMDLIDASFEGLKVWLIDILPAGFLTDLLTEGIITGLAGVVIFVPQIAFLFFFIALLEESGYMARVVFLMDRVMRPFGFSGRSVIPLMGGMACAIPSIMMTRNIPQTKERLITILVTPLMSCSARIPVYTLLIAMFVPAQTFLGIDIRGFYMTGLYLLGFVMALLVAFVFKQVLKVPGVKGVFVMEMPAYRMPRWKNVGITVWQKAWSFITEAGKIILGVSVVLWFLVAFGPGDRFEQIEQEYQPQIEQAESAEAEARLERAMGSAQLEASYAARLGQWIEPVIRPLGFDWKIGISLITSFAAREVFVSTMSIIYQQADPSGLEEGQQLSGRQALISRMKSEINPITGRVVYSHATIISLLIFYAFAMQCMSTLAVTAKEAGWKWAMIMLAYLTALAWIASFLTYQVLAQVA